MVQPAVAVDPALDEPLIMDDFPVPAPRAEKAKEVIDWRGHMERSLSVQASVPVASEATTGDQTVDLQNQHASGSGAGAKPK